MRYAVVILPLICLWLIYTGMKKRLEQEEEGGELKSELALFHITEDEKKQLIAMKNSGKTVEAIKKVHDMTGVKLKRAKKYVDSL